MSKAIKKMQVTFQCSFENCGREIVVEPDLEEGFGVWDVVAIDQARNEFWHLCDHPNCNLKLFCFEHGPSHESHSFDPWDSEVEEEASEVENENAQGGNQEAQAVKAA